MTCPAAATLSPSHGHSQRADSRCWAAPGRSWAMQRQSSPSGRCACVWLDYSRTSPSGWWWWLFSAVFGGRDSAHILTRIPYLPALTPTRSAHPACPTHHSPPLPDSCQPQPLGHRSGSPASVPGQPACRALSSTAGAADGGLLPGCGSMQRRCAVASAHAATLQVSLSEVDTHQLTPSFL